MAENAPRQLLVVAFKYPPYAGVGGRRWTHLTRALAERGRRVHVATVDWPTMGPNTWHEGADPPGVVVHRLASFGPHRLKNCPVAGATAGARVLEFLRERLLGLLRRIYWLDEGQFWGQALLPFAEGLVRREGVRTVAVTGPPFSAVYWAARLRARLPDVRLVVDYRDPWNDDPSLSYPHGWARRGGRRMEDFALATCDAFVGVTVSLCAAVARRLRGDAWCVHLPSGFQPRPRDEAPAGRPRPLHLLHAGDLLVHRGDTARRFLETVRSVRGSMAELKVHLLGGVPPDLAAAFGDLVQAGVLECAPYVAPAEALRRIEGAFAGLVFCGPNHQAQLASKVFDYAGAGRPIACIDHGGETRRFVLDHDLGWSADAGDPDDIERLLREVHALWLREPGYVVPAAATAPWRWEALAAQYDALLAALEAGGPCPLPDARRVG